MNEFRQLIIALIDEGRLTGDLDSLELDGESILRPPLPTLTEWGGQRVPELDAVRPRHAALVEKVNKVCEANGSNFRAPGIPEFHIFNEQQDGNERYAEELASADNAATVQSAYAKAKTLNAWVGRSNWVTFIPGVEDHALWSTYVDEADMIAQYEFEIRKWSRWLSVNG